MSHVTFISHHMTHQYVQSSVYMALRWVTTDHPRPGIPACSQPTMSTQPSALREMVKWAIRRWWVDSQRNSVGLVCRLVAD